MTSNRVFVISGPAGVGKGTVVSALRKRFPDLYVSISATTRPPRRGEVDGVHYFFVDENSFDQMIAGNDLLEWALVHRKYRYGTPRRPIEEAIASGRTAILEIDLQGARQVRQSMPQAYQIFLKPPSWDELVRRLTGRGTESAEAIDRRLATARTELAAAHEFDSVVVNARLEETVDELVDLLGLSN